MKLEEINKEYDKLQNKYGAIELDSVYGGGCVNNPDICFVFMNPTKRNIASSKSWKGIKYPWIGTKNVWDLFYKLDLIDKDIYEKIKSIKGSEWTEDFASVVYDNVTKHKLFITNLSKCTQLDARELSDAIHEKYLHLLEQEISIINPKVVILFGNQVSSIVLDKTINVSKERKNQYKKIINNQEYKCYPVFYPVGNGRFNIDKAIEDLKWIFDQELK